MSDALQTGLYLTVAGMGLVFLVLAMLWGFLVLLLKFLFFFVSVIFPLMSEMQGKTQATTSSLKEQKPNEIQIEGRRPKT